MRVNSLKLVLTTHVNTLITQTETACILRMLRGVRHAFKALSSVKSAHELSKGFCLCPKRPLLGGPHGYKPSCLFHRLPSTNCVAALRR